MDFVHSLVLFLHFVGTAALLGGWLATFRNPTVLQWQHIGAWTQLVTGVALVGLLEMGDGQVNHIKIAVKLVVLIAVLVAAIIGRRKVAKDQPVSTGLAHAVGGLTLVNVALAVFW
ncbi:hypothetical protein [Micrococcus terreus]|uniref:hypothetical protein n=1 Tax=Micrococcus terreus TaxID=574650 RepID=UPI0025514F21|nr:hypothetical protein [Micrococcus terreus]MDK7700155.1 hypothetical protein [Micrococcus terreus]WOO96989.1 hypothetical protein R3I42_10760 [Micrococcus terreus]